MRNVSARICHVTKSNRHHQPCHYFSVALSSSCSTSDDALQSSSTVSSGGWPMREADEGTAASVLALGAPAFPCPSCFLPKFRKLVCVDRWPDGGVGTTPVAFTTPLPLLLLPRDAVGDDGDITEGVRLILSVLFGADDDDDDDPDPVPACEAGGTGRRSSDDDDDDDDPPAAMSRAGGWSCCCCCCCC